VTIIKVRRDSCGIIQERINLSINIVLFWVSMNHHESTLDDATADILRQG